MNILIMYLIKNHYVPVQKTSVYQIIALYCNNCLSTDDSWGELTTPGTRPLLSHQGLDHLVSYVKKKTLDGSSVSFSQVKMLVRDRIIYEWNQRFSQE